MMAFILRVEEVGAYRLEHPQLDGICEEEGIDSPL